MQQVSSYYTSRSFRIYYYLFTKSESQKNIKNGSTTNKWLRIKSN